MDETVAPMDSVESVNIVLINPHNYVHSLALLDVGRLLAYSFASLGVPCQFRVNTFDADAINLVLGYHLVEDPEFIAPFHPVIYQLEQLSDREGWFDTRRQRVLQTASVIWDYAPENLEFLRGRGFQNLDWLPIGFHESLETIPQTTQDVDVLFYGSTNARRQRVFDALSHDVHLKVLFGVYGTERDKWIARSRIILNVHYYERQILEQVRLSYLINNRRFVLSESSQVNPFGSTLPTADYDELAKRCREYLDRPEERESQAEAAYHKLRQRPMTESLREVWNRRPDSPKLRCA